MEITLAAGSVTGTYALQTAEDNYLAAPVGDNNWLLNQSTVDAAASWDISIDSDAKASIESHVVPATDSKNHNLLKYGPQNTATTTFNRFACYKTSSTGVYLSSIFVKEIDSTSVSLDEISYEANVNDTFELTATASGFTPATYEWTSSDDDVAEINAGTNSAVITCKKGGAATITVAAKSADNSIIEYASCEVTVIKQLTNLSVTGTCNLEYVEGQEFDPDGLTVTATYSDSTTEDVTNEVEWTPSPLTAGTTSVIGTYAGEEIEINGLTVDPIQLEYITISGQTETFVEGTQFAFGGTVTAHYNNGTDSDVTASATFTGYDLSTPGIQTVTVSYTDGGVTETTTYDITVNAKELSSISVTGAQVTYKVGDEFVKPTVTAHYNNGTTEDVTAAADCSGYNMDEAGEQTVTVSYGGKTTTYTITVYKELASIEVVGTIPEQTRGNNFVKPTIQANYTDSTNAVVTDQVTFTGYDKTTAGVQTITASYTEADITKTTEFEVTVNKPLLIQISVSNPKTSYLLGDTFVKPTVMALYGDAVEEDVTDLATFTGYNMNQTGVQTVTVSYTEAGETETTTYQITVTATLASISASGQKVEFWVNDTFEFGGTVTATYSDSSSKQITSGYYVDHSQVDMTTVGTYTVTVSYEENNIEKSTSYQVTIKKEVLASVSISGNTKTQFEVGDDFAFNGTVTATYESGKHYDVTANAVFTGYDMNVAGTQTVTVSYTMDGVTKSTSYTITVTNPGGGGDDSSSSEVGSSSEGGSSGGGETPVNPSSNGFNPLWIIPIAIGGTVLLAGLGVGIFFFVKARKR